MSGELLKNGKEQNNVTGLVKEQIDRDRKKVTQLLCPMYYSERKNDTDYGRVENITYYSATTGCDRKANVLLPPDYTCEEKYPVLFFMHGIFGNENSMIFEEANKLDIIFGNLIAEGETDKAIVVFPNMFATGNPDIKPGFSSEQTAPYDNFINDLVDDLIPYIEEKYSVIADREHRAIVGFSMGGRETLFIGLNKPDLFGAFGAFAPAPGLVPSEDAMMKHEGQFVDEKHMVLQDAEMPDLIMICCGDSDSVVRPFPMNYHNILSDNCINHIWYEIPEADHDSITVRSGFYNFLIRWKAINQ